MQLMTLFYRQSCPGGAYYVCQNGFKGCCSVNPCDPGGTCPDTTAATSSSSSTKSTQTPSSAVKSSTTGATTTASTTARSTTSQSSSSATSTSSSTSTSTSSSSTSSVVPTATSLTCPGANGTSYTDSAQTRYLIRCNADNSYSSYDSTNVTTGGFGQCFGACSNVTSCAGFTFVGTDSGQCYLKSMVPSDTYTNTAGSNFVTCTVLERGNEQPSQSTGGSKKSLTGIIAGAVVGGVAAIVLLLVLLAFCIRRRRKKVDEITSATQKSHSSPKEAQENEPLFAPLGGFYRGKGADGGPAIQHNMAVVTLPPKPKAAVAEEQQPLNPNAPPELEGNPIYQKATPTPALVEMDGTSRSSLRNAVSPVIDESPVLGRHDSSKFTRGRADNLSHDVRRRQHIMSWNNYDARDAVSPPSSMSYGLSPKILSPDVSPIP